MKRLIYSVAFTLIGLGVNAQTESQLAEWQANNPGKLIMSQANYERMDPEMQELIASSVVFKHQIDFKVSSEASNASIKVELELYVDADFIKNWIAQHQYVKIIRRSEYNAASSEVQAMYNEPHILVLIGETLTKQDIFNY